jgi:hypothetical protein
MLPAGVSIRMLAWPVPVIRTLPPLPARRRLRLAADANNIASGRRRRTHSRIVDVCVPDYGESASRTEGADVAGNEPVTSPDQHKPANMRLLRIGAVVTAVIILAMAFGNHKGKVEDIFLGAIAASLILLLIIDWVLRRNGLRS